MRTSSDGAVPAVLETAEEGLKRTHHSAAASIREGQPGTLTVLRLQVPPTPGPHAAPCNAFESMISISRDHARNVKTLARRADGAALVRAGMLEAAK